MCSNTISNTWLPAAVHRGMWCLINKQVISSSCSSSRFSMCPWVVFSAYYCGVLFWKVIPACFLCSILQSSTFLLHSKELKKIRQARLVVASCRKSDTHLDRVHFSRAAPISLSCAPFLKPLPYPLDLLLLLQQMKRGSHGQQSATLYNPGFSPGCMLPGLRVLWGNSRSLKTKSKVQREFCKWKLQERL